MRRFCLRSALGGGDEALDLRGHSEGDGGFMPEESHNRENFVNNAIFRFAQDDENSCYSRHTEEQHLQRESTKFPRPLWERVRVRGVSKNNNKLLIIDWIVSHTLTMTKNFPNNAILRGLNNCSPQNDCENCVAHSNNSRKVAFTEPSRGMSGAKVEQTSVETLSFRCVCERCRLMRGDVHKTSRKVAFTLAEVLITLGIIGVVAVLTIPTIIQNYKKSVIETSVKRFYTTMNQAIILSERENGDMHNWSRTPWSGDGAPTWDKYFDKYVVTVERKKTNDGRNTIFVFPDGSGLIIHSSDFFYCTKADLIYKNDTNTSNPQCMLFGFYPNYPVNEPECLVATYRNKGIEPYINGSVDCSKINDTKTLCEYYHYYGRVLQINGWKFPKDCKVKF